MPVDLTKFLDTPQLRVVLDTNVIMAFWYFRDPKLMQLWQWLEDRRAVLLTRKACMDELQRVLAYDRFQIAAADQADIVASYTSRCLCVSDADAAQLKASQALPQCKDKDDQKFIELAWDTQAQLLLTRDKLLLGLARRPVFRDRIQIATPEQLIKALIASSQWDARTPALV